MRTTIIQVSAVLAAILSLAGSSAQAQSANITATATVFQAMTVTGARTLDFGTVFPGVAKAIGVAAATSGRFDLTGQNSANVNLTFTLPANLTNTAPTADLMPIGSWTGCTSPTNTTAGCTAFTPSGSATASAYSGSGALFVFVGGTVTPAANQVAGTYNGTVTLTAAYF
jgi:hypothetical protein